MSSSQTGSVDNSKITIKTDFAVTLFLYSKGLVMKDSTNNHDASSAASGELIPDIDEKYTEDLFEQQLTDSLMQDDEAEGISERRQATLDTRYSFWESFISYAFENPEFAVHFKKKKPTQGRWIIFGVDATGCHIGVVLNLRRNELRVELFIRDDRKLYFTLASQKEAIEAEAGLKFEWRDVGGKNSSVRIENHSFTLSSEEERHKQFDWLIDVILRMRNTFVKYL